MSLFGSSNEAQHNTYIIYYKTQKESKILGQTHMRTFRQAQTHPHATRVKDTG